jgi:hypothetical protein
MGDIIPPGVHLAPLVGRRPSFSIHFLVCLSLLHEFRSLGIGFGLRLVAGYPEQENIFEGLKMTQGILRVAQCFIIMEIISSIHIKF